MIGPNQEKWLQALESGKYLQGRGRLNRDGQFCCLGVACDLFGVESAPYAGSIPEDVGLVKYMDRYGNWNYSSAPDIIRGLLALKDDLGSISSDGDSIITTSLAGMNDDGSSFLEIAKFIRENPTRVFTEPK